MVHNKFYAERRKKMARRQSMAEIRLNPNRPPTPTFKQAMAKRRASVTPSVLSDTEELTAEKRYLAKHRMSTPGTTSDAEQIGTVDGRQSETMFFRFDEKAVKQPIMNGSTAGVSYGTIIDEDASALETSPLLSGTQ